MDLKTNWNVFSKNRDAIYGVAIISIIIFHFFEKYFKKLHFFLQNCIIYYT